MNQSRAYSTAIAAWFMASFLAFSFFFAHPFRTPKMLVLSGLLCFLLISAKKIPPLSPLVVALFLWPVASAFWVVNWWNYNEGLFVLIFLGFVILVSGSVDEDARQTLRQGLAWSGPPLALYLLVQKLGLDPFAFEPNTVGGFFGNANATAHFLLLSLCLGRFEKRWFRLIGWTVILAGLAVSQSRGSWLGLLIVAWLNRDKLSRDLQKAGALLLLGGLVFIILFFGQDLRRFAFYSANPESYVAAYQTQPEIIEEREAWFRGKRLSLMTRVFLMGNSLSMLAERPLTGIGLGQLHVAYPKYARAWADDVNMNETYRAVSAHNVFLDVGIQLGIPWLILASMLMFSFFMREDRSYRIAFFAQLTIAMFSINYLNPMMLSVLILLRPKRLETAIPVRRGFVLSLILLFLVLLGGFAYLDHRGAGSAKTAPGARRLALIFPGQWVEHYFGRGDYRAAWTYQLLAFEQDPVGPETIYNTGVIAWELGADGDARWRELAVTAFLMNRRLHPFFKPAETRLSQIESSGLFPERLRDGLPEYREMIERIRALQ